MKLWKRRGAIPLLLAGAIALLGWVANQNADANYQTTNSDASMAADSACPIHLPHGLPAGTPATNDLIVRDIYCLSSNDQTKFADWVAYRLDIPTISGDAETTRDWEPDPAIAPAETLEPDDYTGAHDVLDTDRGHQAPLGSFKGRDWQQTNYLSNITPQSSDLNQGPWRELEEYVRELVYEHGEVYVITGTAYHRPMPQLPGADEPHVIPSGYWKVVMVGDRLDSYFFEQETPKETDFQLGRTTLTDIEGFSGLDFGLLREHYEEDRIPGLE